VVRITLTATGIDKLNSLTEAHLEDLAHLAPTMRDLWEALDKVDGQGTHTAAPELSQHDIRG
jgi:hypothetical protein